MKIFSDVRKLLRSSQVKLISFRFCCMCQTTLFTAFLAFAF